MYKKITLSLILSVLFISSTTFAITNKTRYIDSSIVLQYEGILVQGSIDKQYYYVDGAGELWFSDSESKHTYPALRYISEKAIKLNGFNKKQAIVVDQKIINNSIFRLPVMDKEKINKIDLSKYKVCDNLFSYSLKLKFYKTIGCVNNVGNNCLNIKYGDLEKNGYKQVTDILSQFGHYGDVGFSQVFEKNDKLYLVNISCYYSDQCLVKDRKNYFSKTSPIDYGFVDSKIVKSDYVINYMYEADKSLFNCK